MRAAASKVLAIAGSDLRRLSRDRTALFFMAILPVLIILLIGLATGGQSRALRLGIVAPSRGQFSTELRQMLIRSPQLRVEDYRSASALQAAVRHQEVLGGVVVPADYDAAISSGRGAVVQVVTGPAQSSLAARTPVAAVVARQAAMVQAARVASAESGSGFAAAYDLARAQATKGAVSVDVRVAGGSAPLPLGFSYTAPSR
jgi:ABC-2 type transport system permease protein